MSSLAKGSDIPTHGVVLALSGTFRVHAAVQALAFRAELSFSNSLARTPLLLFVNAAPIPTNNCFPLQHRTSCGLSKLNP